MLYLRDKFSLWIIVAMVFVSIATESMGQRNINISLVQIDSVDFCGDKYLIVGVNLGTLTPQDNLLLYEYVIQYESDKLAFERVLTVGTLSDGIEFSGSGKLDSNTIRVYGFNINRPIRGSGYIVAMLFRITGDCFVTPKIKTLDNPDINPDAKVRYVSTDSLSGNIKVKSKGSLKAEFSKDTIVVLDTISSFTFPFAISKQSSERVDTMYIRFNYPKGVILSDSLEIRNFGSEIKKVHKSGLLNDTVEYTIAAKQVDFVNADGVFRFTRNMSNVIDNNYQIKFDGFETNKCSCLGSSNADVVNVIVAKSTSVIDEISNSINVRRNGDFWELTSEDHIKELKAFDMVGRMYDVLLDESGIGRIRMPDTFSILYVRITTMSNTKTLKLMKY